MTASAPGRERGGRSSGSARVWAVVACSALVGVAGTLAATAAGQGSADASTTDWAVEEGFTLDVDTTGYDLPTAIAFVPDPGDAPDDPLYFVTELRGSVKVVTNDRTVRTFATVAAFKTEQDPRAGSAQAGLAGICLEPRTGYVFVTYTYLEEGILRNDVTRFGTEPGTFALEPTSEIDFTEVFAPYQSAPPHQVGACQAVGGSLFVSVGDGGNPAASRDLGQLLGKVVCMTLDGEPCLANPFRDAPGVGPGARYVWAYGFRNPFGLEAADGGLYSAENGINMDRFVRIERGRDYLWNGSDESIATGAEALFIPAISPVHVDRYPEGRRLFPEQYRGSFYIAASGRTFGAPGTDPGERGVVRLPYDLEAERPAGVPSYFVSYTGSETQSVVGLAFGPDGLYFSPIFPDSSGETAVLRLRYEPDDPHPNVIGAGGGHDEGFQAMSEAGCFSCHSLEGQGGGIGPSLDGFSLRSRVLPRITSETYEQQLARINELEGEPFASFREERDQLLDADGAERLRLYLKSKIIEPKFDNPGAQMPNLGVTEEQAETISAFLADQSAAPGNSLLDRIERRQKAIGLGFAVGFAAATALILGWLLATRLVRSRRRPPPAAGAHPT
ncbi:MAG: PQQ-dependent sugar dehydrogenase [Gaiellaceae bacterium]